MERGRLVRQLEFTLQRVIPFFINNRQYVSGRSVCLRVEPVVDDYHNFTTGFLFAGSPCVISTLWSIRDLPSALLMHKNFSLWPAKETPAGALREAQRWLRTLKRGQELDEAVNSLTSHLKDLPSVEQHCRDSAEKYADAFGEFPFASPVHWAAFTCSGAGYL